MSAKDKENKTLMKLKQFFKFNKGGTGNFKGRVDFALTPDIEKDLSPETPLNQRTKVIKELSDAVLNNHIEDNAIGKLWVCLEDLFRPDVAKEHRHLAFSFFRCLIQGQYEKIGVMRGHFFRVIKTHGIPEDVPQRFELLQSLTENGKDILYFEEEIGQFLLQWLPEITGAGKTQDFLAMLVNVIKFNAAYIDDDVIAGFVQNTCILCCWSNSPEVVLACLQVLDTVVCYSNLPSESLPNFISALCRTVNFEAYCQSSWKIMRNLLGTHMGHCALYTMCRLLQEPSSLQDVHLLRGAVFYINMALWGTKRVPTLKYTPTSVLPSFLFALRCNNTVVMYEVMLSIQRLVNKYGLELQDPAWDLVLSIIETIINHIEVDPQAPSAVLVANHLHDTICTIEQLIELGQFNGSVRRVFELIERCSPVRPEASVLRLVSYLASSIVPTRSLWLSKLNVLLERYFKQEMRTNIRVKVLDVLSNVIQCNRASYEDDLIERVVVPHLQHIDTDPDIVVRNAAAQLLIDLCLGCENKRCLELLDILGKILNKPYEQNSTELVGISNEAEIIDIKTVVLGLIKIFTAKLYQLPSSHAIKAYKLLVSHLETHYQKPVVFDNTSSIRYMIFECFLQLRANGLYHLGFPEPGTSELCFSPYLGVDHKDGERAGGSASPPPMSPAPTSHPPCVVTQLSLTQACKAVITCLKQEKDWKVLHLILKEVPQVMQNKALILSRHGNDIDFLASALCSMVSDKTLGLLEALHNTPPKFTRSDFHNHVFPVLASLASYHAHLEPSLQQRLVKCLEVGLVSRCARQCVMALTTCTLEMRDTMYKLLPEVLLNLSKISATVHIAIPILEFLSTLTCLPKVFASFVGDQYMSVFAISLPYTNPFRYNHYTVSLAHHVIAVWFLKCRLPFRRDFVKYITTGLKANVLAPFEEGQVMKADLINEDSSNRKRSSSLTEQGNRRSVRPITANTRLDGRPVDIKPPIDESLMTFHVELTETCIDLMARYTFSTCSALPKRLPTADFLLSGGQTMTWLLGNKLITITTSGCSQKVLRNGLCDKCWLLCHPDKDVQSPDGAEKERHVPRPQRASIAGISASDVPPTKEDKGPPSRLSRQISANSTVVRNVPTTAGSSPVDDSKKQLGSTQESHEPEPHKLDQLIFGPKEPERQEHQLCACWCQGWAEIYIRRPTGDMSWAMRIQNQSHYQTSQLDFPLADITALFMPTLVTKKDEQLESLETERKCINSENLAESEYDAMLDHHFEEGQDNTASTCRGLGSGPSHPMLIPGSPVRLSPSRQSSHESVEGSDHMAEDYETSDAEGADSGKSRNPVRRSNSSPEMSASWKNPFLNREKEREGQSDGEVKAEEAKKPNKQSYSKDPRVSCEAIPEEIAGMGTTPPTVDLTNVAHPSLLSCHSYPGTAQQSPSSVQPSANRTVPPSPTSLTSPPLRSAAPQSSGTITGTTSASQQPLVTSKPPQSPSLQHRVSADLPKPQARAGADVKSAPESRLASGEQKPSSSADQNQKLSSRQLSSPLTQLSINTGASADKICCDQTSKEDLSRPDPSALPPLSFKRGRGHTISVMSPVRKPRIDWSSLSRDASPRGKDAPRSGISPSFVFLQLYHTAHFGSTPEKPLLVSTSKVIERAVKNLDLIPQYETHRLGVIYVGQGQASNESEILRNQFGSLRYAEFLQRLGTLINLRDAASQNIFLGGLDRNGDDGKFAYIWQDDVMQVIFHVATLMPTKDNDPLCNDKKKHIGNDYVTLVYNESGEEYNIQTVKGQFNYACVIIQPLDHNTNQVMVKTKEVLTEHIGHSEPKIVSDQNLAIMARQLALHANLASMISCKKAQGQDPYASNWLERLRQIKRLRTKVIQESAPANSDSSSTDSEVFTSPKNARRVHMDDFTEYT